MKYYLYLDDSGNLHKNSGNRYFFYGGLLVNENNKDKLKNNYRNKVKSLLNNHKSYYKDEIKGSNIKNRHRVHLLENLKYNCKQVFIAIEQKRYPNLGSKSPKDLVRFKNYVIKYLIVGLFMKKYLVDCTELHIVMDNQNIAVNAKSSLEDYLHNCINYEKYYMPETKTKEFLTEDGIKINVKYCNSKNNYLVQAADLLVNTMWRYYEKGINFTDFTQKNAVFVNFSSERHIS